MTSFRDCRITFRIHDSTHVECPAYAGSRANTRSVNIMLCEVGLLL